MAHVKIVDDVSYSSDPYPDDYDYEDRWARRPDDYEDHSIKGVSVVEDGKYYDLEVGFEVERGEEYFLLYGVYSTGSSFSHTEGKIEFVDLYTDRDVAEENAKRLRKHYDEGGSGFSCKLLHESGKEYDFCTPWKGYFESLSYLEVEPVHVVTESSRY